MTQALYAHMSKKTVKKNHDMKNMREGRKLSTVSPEKKYTNLTDLENFVIYPQYKKKRKWKKKKITWLGSVLSSFKIVKTLYFNARNMNEILLKGC
jgi:hypothetical protein